MKILFVCRGNVGRSQMAEALYKKYGTAADEVISAGTKLSGPEEPLSNIPLIENVFDSLNDEGIDIRNVERTQLTPEMAAGADKIILTLEDHEEIPEFLKDNPKVERWTVSDPKGTDLETHIKVKNQIKDLMLKRFSK